MTVDSSPLSRVVRGASWHVCLEGCAPCQLCRPKAVMADQHQGHTSNQRVSAATTTSATIRVMGQARRGSVLGRPPQVPLSFPQRSRTQIRDAVASGAPHPRTTRPRPLPAMRKRRSPQGRRRRGLPSGGGPLVRRGGGHPPRYAIPRGSPGRRRRVRRRRWS